MRQDFHEATLRVGDLESDCILFETNHCKALKEECLRLGYMVFELRHDTDEWGTPCTIEHRVLVDFWGYMAVSNVATGQALWEKIAKEGFCEITESTFDIGEFFPEQEIPRNTRR